MCQYLACYGFLLRFVWPYFYRQEWCTTRSAFLKLHSFSWINVKVWWWCHQSSWWMNKKAVHVCMFNFVITTWQDMPLQPKKRGCFVFLWRFTHICFYVLYKSYWIQSPTYWHLCALVSLVSLMWHSSEFCCHLLTHHLIGVLFVLIFFKLCIWSLWTPALLCSSATHQLCLLAF